MKHIALLLLSCAAPASAASLYLETFSTDNDNQGWFEVTNGSTPFLAQNPATDALDFSATGYGLFYVAADALASGGAFSGNYNSAGVYGFQFDLTIATGSSVTELYFEIANLTEGETWQYSLAVPGLGSTASFNVPLDGGAGWTQTSGNENFGFILSQSEEIGVVFANTATGDLAASIDNVTAVPEPTVLTLVGLAGLMAAMRCRRSA